MNYAKVYDKLTFEELEGAFRDTNMNPHLIAMQKEVLDTQTIVNLQGETDQKFAISIQFCAKPRRAKFAEMWPTSPEENITRLPESGFIMDAMVDKCLNCGRTYPTTHDICDNDANRWNRDWSPSQGLPRGEGREGEAESYVRSLQRRRALRQRLHAREKARWEGMSQLW